MRFFNWNKEYLLFLCVDLQKQIEYWVATSEDDLITVDALFEKERYLHCLFFLHLSLEKALKALVVKATENHPPKTHKLSRLAKLAEIEITIEQKIFFSLLMDYQISGRYPEYQPDTPSAIEMSDIIKKAKEEIKWLKKKLEK
ncbi:HEPN domain-containing protein [Candidatus Kapabacteria bacterium]|nr:HEPN domain-containing protein [Candidatus Kapabacteria bacterium]